MYKRNTCEHNVHNSLSMAPGKLIVVTAPSGAGKTTLVNSFLNRYSTMCLGVCKKECLVLSCRWQSGSGVRSCLGVCSSILPVERVITTTSRKPRPGEVDGVDYHFIGPDDFQKKISLGHFLEWSSVYGTYYGTSALLEGALGVGVSLIAILDRQGARALKQKFPNSVHIGIGVSSLETLRHRLEVRGGMAPDQVNKRIMIASEEIREEGSSPLFDKFLVNDDLGVAQEEFDSIVKSLLVL